MRNGIAQDVASLAANVCVVLVSATALVLCAALLKWAIGLLV